MRGSRWRALDLLVAMDARRHRRDGRPLPAHGRATLHRDLDGCVVACPLHEGRFDLVTGETVQMPTTGGLDADGNYHSPCLRLARSSNPSRRPGRSRRAA